MPWITDGTLASARVPGSDALNPPPNVAQARAGEQHPKSALNYDPPDSGQDRHAFTA